MRASKLDAPRAQKAAAAVFAIALTALALVAAAGPAPRAFAATGGNAAQKTPLTASTAGPSSVTVATRDNGLVDGHVYVIRSALGASYVLDVAGGSKANSANVRIRKARRILAQQWRYNVDARGRATLTCVGTGKVLDVAGGSRASGANVQQYRANGTKAQRWKITRRGDGSYTIASTVRSKRLLDVADGRRANGTNVQIAKANGSKAQRWTFYDVTKMRSVLAKKARASADTCAKLAGKTYYIVSALSRKVALDVAGGSKATGANVQAYRTNGTRAQRWKITFDAKGYATLANASGTVLSVAGGKKMPGANVQQGKAASARAKKWIVSKNADGTYTFRSALWSNLVLDIAGGKAKSGANVQTATASGAKSQKWRLTTNVFSLSTLAAPIRQSLVGISTKNVRALGIDVSVWQGAIDWKKVAAAGVDFAIIRCGYGSDYTSQDDSCFLANVKGARAAGLDLGVYLYSYAQSTDDAVSEANHTLRLLKAAGLTPSKLRYGVSYDIEDPSQAGLWLPGLCNAYGNAVKAAGYKVNIYSYLNWWNTKLADTSLGGWGRYIAEWPVAPAGSAACSYTGPYMMWQYTSSGSVPGIEGRVDMDLAY